MPIKSLEVSNLTELLDCVREIQKGDNFACWYRGHSSQRYQLVPGIFRDNHDPRVETYSLMEFKRRAPIRYSACPDDSNLGAWLCLAQHYRLPTRLLDWTESLAVAAVFACEGRGDGEVWALKPEILHEWTFRTRGGMKNLFGFAMFEAHVPLVVEAIKAAFTYQQSDGLVLPMQPHERDHRMLLQQSCFTLHGGPTALTELECAESILARIRINEAAKKELRESLRMLGVSSHTIFCDLENLAKWCTEDALRRNPGRRPGADGVAAAGPAPSGA